MAEVCRASVSDANELNRVLRMEPREKFRQRVEAAVLSRNRLDLRVKTRAPTPLRSRKLIAPRLPIAYSGVLITCGTSMNFLRSHAAGSAQTRPVNQLPRHHPEPQVRDRTMYSFYPDHCLDKSRNRRNKASSNCS